VRLTDLIAQYQDLEPQLVGPPPNEGLWTGIKRGLSSLITVHRADRPSSQPAARYERALSHLMAGEVDAALAETMRLPGAPRAQDWINSARQYVAVHRALDEVESAALIGKANG
jgi:predicted Zn-dependent protease